MVLRAELFAEQRKCMEANEITPFTFFIHQVPSRLKPPHYKLSSTSQNAIENFSYFSAVITSNHTSLYPALADCTVEDAQHVEQQHTGSTTTERSYTATLIGHAARLRRSINSYDLSYLTVEF